jgi:glucuronoarabinoxylan endo-1,4-beta-xylanase
MKKLLILSILIIITKHLLIVAQITQINYDFSDANTRFAVINMDAVNPSYELSIVDNILNINTNKKTQDWSFLQLYNLNLDISVLPTLEINVRTNSACNFIVRLKAQSYSDPQGDPVQIEETLALSAADTFQIYFVDLENLISENSDFNASNINEIQIDITKGWNESFSGIVQLDYFKIGFSESLPYGGSGFFESFDEGIPPLVESNTSYAVDEVDGTMKIEADKDIRWAGLRIPLNGNKYDITSNPVLNLKIKSDIDFVLQLFLVDENGNGYQTEIVGAQYLYYELVANKNVYQQVRIYKGKDFIQLSFDFLNVNGIIDLTKISEIVICANGTATSFEGTFYIDDIRIGDGAEKYAYIAQIPDYSYYKNSTDTKQIIIPEIKNAASIIYTGGESLIDSVIIDEIAKEGYSKFKFTLINDAEGKDTIYLTAVGSGGYLNNTVCFGIKVTGNMEPEIDNISDTVVKAGTDVMIKLTGISDGDKEAKQDLTITSVSNDISVIDTVNVLHSDDNMEGYLLFNPDTAGTTTITVNVTDEFGAFVEKDFDVIVYKEINVPPTVDPVTDMNVQYDEGEQNIMLTNISDGDDMTQTLSFTISVSNDTTITDTSINYTQGDSIAEFIFTPVPGVTGSVSVTITLSDDGGNPDNDGNKSTRIIFDIELIGPKFTGFEFDLDDPNTLSRFLPEGAGVIYNLSLVDKGGEKALKIEYIDKWTYGGIWTALPVMLDLTGNEAVSYEIFSEGGSSWHWNYFYDINDERNIENTTQHQFEIPADEWTEVIYDYRQQGDMNNETGQQIDITNINALLINLHGTQPTWPFTNTSGTVYYRNIKFGDLVDLPVQNPYTTIDNIPDQSVFVDPGICTMTLTGISNGKGSTDNVEVSFEISDTNIIKNLTPGTLNSDGRMTLFYIPASDGTVEITVTVSATEATSVVNGFEIIVLDNKPAGYAKVKIDKSETYQTIRGFGTFTTADHHADLYLDMGSSAVRIGIIENQWESVNDNGDPNVTDMSAFNYEAFDWDYYSKLKADGISTFIITSWSPPAWMKRNLSLNHKEQAIEWENTDNILEPYYYDEFAESIAALVKAFKQKCDIDITAVGLQNEPFFNEPYPSAIISGEKFAEIIKITGDRFVNEGLGHVGFYMPEQVFGLGWAGYSNEGYLAALKANQEADEYCDFFAVHGYDGSGITPGFPDYSNWADLWDAVQEGDNPKEIWMTETEIRYEGFESAMQFAGALHGSLWAGNVSLWTNYNFGGVQLTTNEPNSTYYASMNYFKFIHPGAIRLDTESDNPDILVTAFENTDGEMVIILINKGNSSKATRLVGDNLPAKYKVYRTSQYENLVSDTSIVNTDALILPPLSITTLVAEENNILYIDHVEDVILPLDAGLQTIILTGISKQSGETEGLTLEVYTGNEVLIENLNVGDVNEDSTAVLQFTPAAGEYGSAEILLSLSDGLGNSTEINFYVFVKVLSMDDIPNQSVLSTDPKQYIEITGISDGTGVVDQLSLQVSSDNPDLILFLDVSEINPDRTATISFNPSRSEEGTATITVTLTDGVNTLSKTFDVTVTLVTAIKKTENDKLNIYPNPTAGKLFVKLYGEKYENIVITDLTGKVIENRKIQPLENDVEFDLENFGNGVYIITIFSRDNLVVSKFIKM